MKKGNVEMTLRERVEEVLKTSKPEILQRAAKHRNLVEEVIAATNFLNPPVSMSQRLWHIINDLMEEKRCEGRKSRRHVHLVERRLSLLL